MAEADLAALLAKGMAQQSAGQFKAAIQIYGIVAKRDAASAAVRCRLGDCYAALGDFERADRAFRAAIERAPDLGEPYHKAAELAARASVLAARAGHAQAARNFRAGALGYLHALAARRMARGAWADAEALLRRGLALGSPSWGALVDLGQCLHQARHHRAAEDAIRQAIALAPSEPLPHYHLGLVLARLGRTSEGAAAFRHALTLAPSFAPAREALAQALLAESWDEGEAPDGDPLSAPQLMLPVYRGAGPEEILERHRAWGARAVAAATAAATADERQPFGNSRDPGRRLRVGYVSPDFRDHSVAYFLEPLFAHHDPAAVEVFCYAEVALPDDTTARLRALAPQWRSTLGQDDAGMRRQVRHDGIDILVDLAGHTAGNRLAAFALKPAPITATWLGYPASTGLATIDWRITDAIADPAGSDAHYAERLLRLPGAFLCFAPPADAPAVGPCPAAQNGHVTFGSFNNLRKLTPAAVATWAAILDAVPGSRLVLKALLLRDPAAQRRVRDRFAAHGIAETRLDLSSGTRDRTSHLAAYGGIDVALDTFPYNGTATTCEALWMGVPVVAVAGDRHSARVGQTVLHHARLDELVQPDRRAYIDCAVRLAGDSGARAAFRAELRHRVGRSALCDGAGFAAAFEAGLRRIWQDWCGAPPS